jgi:hypothetical protein
MKFTKIISIIILITHVIVSEPVYEAPTIVKHNSVFI